MKRKVIASTADCQADTGNYSVYQLLPNSNADAVGPFVYLDHAMFSRYAPNGPHKAIKITEPYPQRGVAVLTYVLNGEALHVDSKGNSGKACSGGIQWLKTGKGLVQDETIRLDCTSHQQQAHVFHFWINLPAKNKAECAAYLSLLSSEIPEHRLGDLGWLKVIIGAYGNLVSVIPAYTGQFIYHLHLEPEGTFSIQNPEGWDCAAFLPFSNAVISGDVFNKGDLVLIEKDQRSIEISSRGDAPTDLLLLGGEPYAEPFIAEGPFVMNTEHEITQAYNDYYEGKYGKIDYNSTDEPPVQL